MRVALAALILSLTSMASLANAESSPVPTPNQSPSGMPVTSTFSVDGRLRKNLDFWIRIYSQYHTRQGLIHDAKYIDLVYEVMDLDPLARQTRQVRDAKKKWREILFAVHRKQKTPDKLTPEERKVFDLYKDVDEPNKFLNAAHRKRLRFQLGQKDRFLEGLKESGRYLPMMEDVFRKAGLPAELTRLPFVESSFNTRARSKVGASGIWQFMRSTGRLFLRINESLDERNDPIRATEAAARLLKTNFDALGSWPLAVTAYNHGRQGIMRAVRKVGSESLEDVVEDYRSRSFGFASSNFFCELLAAIEVERNADKYFGKIEREKPLITYEVELPDSIAYPHLEKFLSLNSNRVRELNPGLTDLVYDGKRRIPAHYRLRLPPHDKLDSEGAVRVFLAGYTEIPKAYKFPAQRGDSYGKSR